MSVETRHIAMDVRLDGDEISGRAGDGTGQPKAFEGTASGGPVALEWSSPLFS